MKVITRSEIRDLRLRNFISDYHTLLDELEEHGGIAVIDEDVLRDLPDSLSEDQDIRRSLL